MNELNKKLKKKKSSVKHKKKISFLCFKEPLAREKTKRERFVLLYHPPPA